MWNALNICESFQNILNISKNILNSSKYFEVYQSSSCDGHIGKYAYAYLVGAYYRQLAPKLMLGDCLRVRIVRLLEQAGSLVIGIRARRTV